MSEPVISCVMPTRNRAKLIGESVESIVKQSLVDWELIIVDDHSSRFDSTEKVIKLFNDERIIYKKLTDENGKGIAAARNYGNMISRGKYIAVADSDDIYYPYRFEETVKAFENENADVVYGDIEVWDPISDKIKTRENEFKVREFDREHFKYFDFIPHPTSAYRKAMAIDFPYNSFYRVAEDYDLLSRFEVFNFKFVYVDKPFAKYREHKKSITHQKNMSFDYSEIIRKNRGWK